MPTEDSVKEKLARLLKEVSALRIATDRLTSKLENFSDKSREDAYFDRIQMADFQFPARPMTADPKSPIRVAIYEFGDQKDLSDATRTLIAIAKSLDGALRDIRSSHNFLDTISKDTDMSEAFREWQSKNKR